MRKATLLVCCSTFFFLAACAHHRDTPPARPITDWEKVHQINAQIAIHNNAVAKGIIAANQAGVVDQDAAAVITEIQFHIAAWQRELTPLLKDQATAHTNSDRVKFLCDSVSQAAQRLASTGHAGVRDPQKASALITSIQSLSNSAQSLISMLQTAGILKA